MNVIDFIAGVLIGSLITSGVLTFMFNRDLDELGKMIDDFVKQMEDEE